MAGVVAAPKWRRGNEGLAEGHASNLVFAVDRAVDDENFLVVIHLHDLVWRGGQRSASGLSLPCRE